MGRRILAALAGVMLSLGLLTAPAAAVPSDCGTGEFCLYQNGSSPYYFADFWPGSWPRNQCEQIQMGGISYVYNRTGTRWFVFRDGSCAGAHLEVPPGWAGQIQALPGGSGWDNDPVAVMRTAYTY